jgi:hypothetical protein
MEHQHLPEHRPAQITLHLKSQDLEPDPADIERRQAQLAEDPHLRHAYSLGVLMTCVEGIHDGILDGDGRRVSMHVRFGMAAIAACEAVSAEQQQGETS